MPFYLNIFQLRKKKDSYEKKVEILKLVHAHQRQFVWMSVAGFLDFAPPSHMQVD